MGRKAYQPSEASRKQVLALASFGVRQDQIALYLEVDAKTLRKHYRRELDTGHIQANAAVARRLYSAAVEEGNVAAMIFWLKAQAGWREKQELAVTGADGGPLRFTVVEDFSGDGDAD